MTTPRSMTARGANGVHQLRQRPSRQAEGMSGRGKKGSGKPSTRIAHAGRDRKLTQGGVNPVVQRASTVILESASKLFEPGGWTYGRHGTATHEALKQGLMELEEAQHCALAPSGLMACILPFLALAGDGGHVLVGDN